jgi:hypothetical protein
MDKAQKLHNEGFTYTSVDERGVPALNLNLYPNPASGTLNISTSNDLANNGSILIYDMQGRKLMEAGNLRSNASIDISGLPQGMYMLKYSSGQTSSVKTFIKQ